VRRLAEARERRLASPIFQHPIAEEYDLAPQEQTSPLKTARRLSRTDAEPLEGPDASLHIALVCPTCHESIRARVEATPGRAPCPYCGAMVSVPDRQSVAGAEARKVEP